MHILKGWRLFWAATAGLLVMAAIMLVTAEVTSDGIRLVIRATARTSLILFLAAFMASTMTKLAPGPFSSWLRTNRRYLGLSFAMSHFIHLCAIVSLAQFYPEIFWTLSNGRTIFNGSFGYLAIALLAATSFDGAVRWLGVKNWQRLHTIGSWFIWLSFVFTNGKRIPVSLWYAVPVAILFAALIAKIYAKRQGTKTVSTASAASPG
jgi:DMSO/TMAO reductase YedYZ heme-binding membrane subunit